MNMVKSIGTVLLYAFVALGAGCASTQTGAPSPNAQNASDRQGVPLGRTPGSSSQGSSSQGPSYGADTGSDSSPVMEPYGTYALDGPDLFVVGDFAGTPLQGSLQRKAMVGTGRLKLFSPDNALHCESIIKTRPTDKGRVRGLLDCDDGNIVLFTLRNLGPDQGLGIGASHDGDKDLTIFYHPSAEEAQRRFPQVLEDFTALRQQKRS